MIPLNVGWLHPLKQGAQRATLVPEFFSRSRRADRKEFKVKKPPMNYDEDPLRIPINDIFDLHTVRPQDVKEAVEAYLEEANRLGLKALRIIHGRGIGVQRAIVRAVLARTPFVLSYQDAPLQAGGWGATIVTLR